jgi:arsenical pump membrane protein
VHGQHLLGLLISNGRDDGGWSYCADMPIVQVSLLAVTIIGLFVRPKFAPSWAIPVLAAVVLVAVGGSGASDLRSVAAPLWAPLLFMLLAVPLAAMLDRLGFFVALATYADARTDPRLALWILAAVVTTFLNLDASVVLLTPLYINIARRRGADAAALAFQPALLACLASSALPISNLTNLIAAEQAHVSVAAFIRHLGLPSLVATAVGWFAYKGVGRPIPNTQRIDEPVDRRALRVGIPIAMFVVIGFTFGESVGIPAWAVALVADLVLMGITRHVPLRNMPFAPVLLTSGLAVVASAAAPHLGIAHLIGGDSLIDRIRTGLSAVVGANGINNLPALLVALPLTKQNHDQLWPLLLGVNIGPVLVLHGSLAGLLWRNTAASLGVKVSPWEYTKVGIRVGLPALVAGFVTLMATT